MAVVCVSVGAVALSPLKPPFWGTIEAVVNLSATAATKFGATFPLKMARSPPAVRLTTIAATRVPRPIPGRLLEIAAFVTGSSKRGSDRGIGSNLPVDAEMAF